MGCAYETPDHLLRSPGPWTLGGDPHLCLATCRAPRLEATPRPRALSAMGYSPLVGRLRVGRWLGDGQSGGANRGRRNWPGARGMSRKTPQDAPGRTLGQQTGFSPCRTVCAVWGRPRAVWAADCAVGGDAAYLVCRPDAKRQRGGPRHSHPPGLARQCHHSRSQMGAVPYYSVVAGDVLYGDPRLSNGCALRTL